MPTLRSLPARRNAHAKGRTNRVKSLFVREPAVIIASVAAITGSAIALAGFVLGWSAAATVAGTAFVTALSGAVTRLFVSPVPGDERGF